MFAPTVREQVHSERFARRSAPALGGTTAADSRVAVQALGRAIGNRALTRLLARQAATDAPRAAPHLNLLDPRLRDIFGATAAGSRSSQADTVTSESPPWMPKVRRHLPISIGQGTRRSPKLKEPDGPSEAKCRGACGPDCPDTCKSVGTYTEEYVLGDTGYLIEFPNAIKCGTHEGCRFHDACFDTAVANGETYLFGPRHNQCNQDAALRWPTHVKSWAQGGGPYDDWWYFVDYPVIRRTWHIEAPGSNPSPP